MNPGDEIGGFRLVRLLGSGTRSRVFLGHDGSTTSAIKLFRAGATPESIDDEIAALSSASHPHIVTLREVGTASSGLPFLVLERLEAATLSSVLSARTNIGAGEAVTVLAPIVAAVGALHSSGVAHGSISPTKVLFRGTGAPVLAGLGRATLFVPPGTPAMLATSRPVLEDRLAVGRLVMASVKRLDGPSSGLVEWLTALERDGYPEDFTERLLSRIFALATAAPVRFPAPGSEGSPLAAVATPPAQTTPRDGPPEGLIVEARAGAARARSAVARRLPELLTAARGVRRPVWIAAAVGMASLVAALILVPPGEQGQPVQASQAEQSASTSREPGTATAAGSAVTADDPAAAFPELMAGRELCIRDLSVICLETVVQAGSAAFDDDAALVRSIEGGQTSGSIREVVDGSVEVVERHGDAALVRYATGAESEPASALLVKGEAGWRIRDYLVG